MQLVAEDESGLVEEIEFEESIVLFVIEIVKEISHVGEFG